jgi:hypothetical protein
MPSKADEYGTDLTGLLRLAPFYERAAMDAGVWNPPSVGEDFSL